MDDFNSVEKNQHWFDIRFAHSSFLWSRRARSVPLLTLPLGLKKSIIHHLWSHDQRNLAHWRVREEGQSTVFFFFFVVMDMLKTIPVEDFQRCYQKWEQHLHQYIAAQGTYFEGDNIDFRKKKTVVNKKSVPLIFCHASYFLLAIHYVDLIQTVRRITSCSLAQNSLQSFIYCPVHKHIEDAPRNRSFNVSLCKMRSIILEADTVIRL